MRVVDPPLWVWVNVRKLFAKGPYDSYEKDPTGLELDHEVLGAMTERIWRADGDWLGRVQIELHTRDDTATFGPWTALVPSHLLRYHRRGRRGEPSGLGH